MANQHVHRRAGRAVAGIIVRHAVGLRRTRKLMACVGCVRYLEAARLYVRLHTRMSA